VGVQTFWSFFLHVSSFFSGFSATCTAQIIIIGSNFVPCPLPFSLFFPQHECQLLIIQIIRIDSSTKIKKKDQPLNLRIFLNPFFQTSVHNWSFFYMFLLSSVDFQQRVLRRSLLLDLILFHVRFHFPCSFPRMSVSF
jgi:hypothetical protein